MSRPYTERLLRVAVANVATRYTVQPGMRAVVRNVDIANNTGSAATASLSVMGYMLHLGSVPANGTLHIESRSVAYAGEWVEGTLGAAGMTMVVTGYIFDDATGPRATEADVTREATGHVSPS